MMLDYSLIWFAIIVFATLMYIVMDGFDLGIGIIFPLVRDVEQRDIMVNTVAPVWDGNETWLVLGGAALFGAFPLAYSIIADAFSVPITAMLIGLIFRGVAFEFRFKATPHHRAFWDKAFIGGSILATFAQGVIVGAMLNGLPIKGRTFAGSAMDWCTPFPLFCGIGLLVAYALLGCTWLIVKVEGELHRKMSRLAGPLLIALMAIFAIISAWTPLHNQAVAARWFSTPNIYWLLPIPVMVLICAVLLVNAIQRQAHYLPFILTLILIFLGFAGLGISVWPNIIPPGVTIWAAASPVISQSFMLVGALLIIPVILAYTFWSYYVFRGKVSHDSGYH
jgi:cytochrome bd ubiquinol oxidase subunit II